MENFPPIYFYFNPPILAEFLDLRIGFASLRSFKRVFLCRKWSQGAQVMAPLNVLKVLKVEVGFRP